MTKVAMEQGEENVANRHSRFAESVMYLTQKQSNVGTTTKFCELGRKLNAEF